MAFFEKIGGAITSGVSSTANKAKDITDQTKLSSEINSKKKELNGVYAQIGKNYVEGWDAASLEQLKNSAIELSKIVDALVDKLNDAKGLKKCECCGETIDNASVFCPHCGGKQTVRVNKCIKCHTVLEDGAVFCYNCGTKQPDLNNIVPAAAETVVAEPVVVEPVIEEPVVEEAVVEEPAMEEPVVEETVVEEPVIEEPIVEETAAEDPIVEEIDVAEPVIEPAEDVVPDFVPAEEPVVEEVKDVAEAEEIKAVEETTEMVSEAQNAMKCPSCGADIDDDAAFCTECGTRIEKTEPAFVFCSNCGNKEEAGAKFCTECGTKF